MTGQGHPAELNPAGVERGQRLALVAEAGLEKRRTAQVALRREHLDEFVERHAGVGISIQAGVPDPREDIGKARLPRQVCAHRQGVGEETDDAGRGLVVTVGHGDADDEILLTSHPVQQNLVGGQQHHERSSPVLTAELSHLAGQPLGN